MPVRSFRGVDLRKALEVAKELGCTIRRPHATSDVIVRHPSVVRSVRVSLGRKDSPRSLTSLLNHLCRSTS